MNKKYFTLGPTQTPYLHEDELFVQLPYFRTNEFSNTVLECLDWLKKSLYTADTSNVALITASGTASMEAAIVNTFTKGDRLLILNGGTFGQRFVDIANIYGIPHVEIKVDKHFDVKCLEPYKGQHFTGLVLNAVETSMGLYYNLPEIGRFCKKEDIVFVVDAIGTFLADEYLMDEWNIDVTVLSSQKGLALHPGLSMVVANEKASSLIMKNHVQSLYLDLKTYFEEAKRGQTPYSPATSVILQLHKRLKDIDQTGVPFIVKHTSELAATFRDKLKSIGFSVYTDSLSNAVTPVVLNQPNAKIYCKKLAERYGIIVNPCGGKMADYMFRVGHMGELTLDDHEYLIQCLSEIKQKEG